MPINLGGHVIKKAYARGAEVLKGLLGGREFHSAARPVSMFDSSVVPGDGDSNVQNATAGCDWAFTRAGVDSINRFQAQISRLDRTGYRATQRLPPGLAVVTSGNNAYVALLRFFMAGDNAFLNMQLAQGSSPPSDIGSALGPQLEEATEDSRGIAFRASDGTTYKWRLQDIDSTDETEPYNWRVSGISDSDFAKLRVAGAQVVLVNIDDPNVDWGKLQFLAA